MDTLPVVTDPLRLAALSETGLIGGAAAANLDRITALAEFILDVPVALVSLVDRDRQVFVSHRGLSGQWAEKGETPLSHSFCQYAVATGEQLVISHARTHEYVSTNLAIEALGAESYAGEPLTTSEGHVLGTLCVLLGVARRLGPPEAECA